MVYAIADKRRRRRHGAVAPMANGGRANAPREITLAGWRDILKRLVADIGRDNISLMARRKSAGCCATTPARCC